MLLCRKSVHIFRNYGQTQVYLFFPAHSIFYIHYGSGLCNGIYTFLNARPTTSQQKQNNDFYFKG